MIRDQSKKTPEKDQASRLPEGKIPDNRSRPWSPMGPSLNNTLRYGGNVWKRRPSLQLAFPNLPELRAHGMV